MNELESVFAWAKARTSECRSMTPATLTMIEKEKKMEIHLISSVNNIAQYGNKNETFYDAASRYSRDVLELDTENAANAAYYLNELKKVLDKRP